MGRGLRSLIPEAPPRTLPEQPASAPAVASLGRASCPQIDIDQIVPNHKQPRERFDEEALDALANSLKTKGVLQPILVRPLADGQYGLIAGERRWRAAQRAGLLKIPAVVKEVPDDRILEFALIENLQREELNPIEEARAYRTLVDDLGLTQQQIADRVGKQRATIANTMRLLSLPEPVRQLVRSGQLSTGHARALLGIEMATEQTELAERTVREGLSVREVEAQVARIQRVRILEGRPVQAATRRDPNVTAAEEALQRAIGTKVRIFQGKKGAGRLEIHFYGAEEMERVYQMLLRMGRRDP